ncbi:MAG: hypothetical protein AAF990_06640 [Bacteroidota bacterium]
MKKKRILFVGGSLNQTTIMYQIAQKLSEFDCFFTPFYADGCIRWLAERQMLDNTILGGSARRSTMDFLEKHQLKLDQRGENHSYDLVVIGTDTVVPKNLTTRRVILVQEGMIDPEDWKYHLVRCLQLPHFFANTSMTGLSHCQSWECLLRQSYWGKYLWQQIIL